MLCRNLGPGQDATRAGGAAAGTDGGGIPGAGTAAGEVARGAIPNRAAVSL
jgi:hypothetical protein